jgi:hypothetical protein
VYDSNGNRTRRNQRLHTSLPFCIYYYTEGPQNVTSLPAPICLANFMGRRSRMIVEIINFLSSSHHPQAHLLNSIANHVETGVSYVESFYPNPQTKNEV